MVRSGRNAPKPEKTQPPPVVVNERVAARSNTASDIPLRTVVYVEVGDMSPREVQAACMQLSKVYGGASPVFVIPVRNQKLATDVVFEGEILDMVNKLCEIVDGKIVLRGGAREADIMRVSA